MMESTKVNTIRAELRNALKMTDPELRAWFNQKLEAERKKTKSGSTEIDTLRLLRDALVKETKGTKPKPRPARASARPRS